MDTRDIIRSVNFKDKVIIDCGHIAIFSQAGSYSFGRFGTPSIYELETLTIGIELLNDLRNSGKHASLSICLSDLAGIAGGNKERNSILQLIKDGKKASFYLKSIKIS